ncbi:hypothetical protein T484DRAFT_1853602 [Baffinella frigidus]|nr:hypothetical protein T484DRAFT_1853602 [Cryptophyta sp. CCMP2293]
MFAFAAAPQAVAAIQVVASAVPGDAVGKKRRVVAKPREHVSRACEPCRKSKIKCDETRPCIRCRKNGRCEACVDWRANEASGAGWDEDGQGEPGSRTLVSRACKPCRSSKLKCDKNRPCGRTDGGGASWDQRYLSSEIGSPLQGYLAHKKLPPP